MRKLIRLFVLALLVPSIYSFAYEAGLFLISEIDLYSINWFIYGFLFYIVTYTLVLRSIIGFLENFEHELGHAIVAFIFLIPIKRFIIVNPRFIEEETSKVELYGSNSLITLAPYYLPVFTIPLFIIKPLIFPFIHQGIDLLIGFTLAFHYTSLLKEFRSGLFDSRSDVRRTGVIFSFIMICILNIVFLTITLCVVCNNYAKVLNYFAGSFVRTLESYQIALQTWRTL